MLRRGYDKIMVTGVIQAGSSLGILVPPSVVLVLYGMIARQPVGQLWLAGVFPGLLMAGLFIAYIAIRCALQPKLGPPLPEEERQVGWAEKIRLLGAGILPLLIFFCDDRAVPDGRHQPGRELRGRCRRRDHRRGAVSRRLTWQVLEDTVRKTLSISCMFMWIILAALCFGAVFDGLGAVNAIEFLFLDQWGLGPWEILIMMQLSYIVMGMFLDDTAMLVIVAPLYVPLVIEPRLRPDLVRRALHHHLPDRLHDPAVRLQPVPDAGHGAAGDQRCATSTARSSRSSLVMILGLAIVMVFPQIALWLPSLYYGA